ncbi:MAG: sugar-transfer associated ATP-grasp domain-containing protein, partial [Pseudomonadota bacterium]
GFDMTSEDKIILDSASTNEMPQLAEVMPRVVKEYGKSLGGQLKDLVSLCIGGNKLTIDEYYKMKLFDDATYSQKDKKAFAGLMKSRRIWMAVSEQNPWHGFMDDKYACEVLLRGFGLTATKTLAIIGETYPGGAHNQIVDKESLQGFFSEAKFPMFGKPVDSNQSLGSARFLKFDANSNMLSISGDREISVDQLWDEIANKFSGKYLFQECVESHPVLKSLCGEGLPTIRIVTIDYGNGPEIYRTLIKLTGKDNVADNFWRKGNMLAPIETESGKMKPALTGFGIDGEFVASHPDTGQAIEGVQIPHWENVKEMALSVSKFLDGARLIGFDIAVSKDGPVLVEVNTGPDFGMLQIAFQEGVLDEKMQAMLDDIQHTKKDRMQTNKQNLRNEAAVNNQKMKQALSLKSAA